MSRGKQRNRVLIGDVNGPHLLFDLKELTENEGNKDKKKKKKEV